MQIITYSCNKNNTEKSLWNKILQSVFSHLRIYIYIYIYIYKFLIVSYKYNFIKNKKNFYYI